MRGVLKAAEAFGEEEAELPLGRAQALAQAAFELDCVRAIHDILIGLQAAMGG